MAMDDLPSSPALHGASLSEELAYYKAQYEHLESELQEFQQSSRELEQELERDIEASEKRERTLKDEVEKRGFEVEEWKAKHKQSKAEANTVQSQLQKEITSLRDMNRTQQLKLRDIEVANDDFERQARHTTSSLEDLESKYNVAIERGVMLEEEMRHGEQEREGLRIETQRLKEELSDLRIEHEITGEKLRLAEDTLERYRSGKLRSPADNIRPPSPLSDRSTSATTLSSPTASTPPPPASTNSDGSALQSTPPSPPLSETSTTVPKRKARELMPAPSTPLPNRLNRKPTLSSVSTASTITNSRQAYTPNTVRPAPRHSRGPSTALSTTSAASASGAMRPPFSSRRPSSRPSFGINSEAPLPRSGSLYKIQTLTQKMQKLEERVHHVRSKLPAPTKTPPRASPRGTSSPRSGNNTAAGTSTPSIPSSVTVRSGRKRQSQSTLSSGDAHPVSRLSFGPAAGSSIPQASTTSGVGSTSRPSSRASITTSSTASAMQHPARPLSRTSLSSRVHHPSIDFSLRETHSAAAAAAAGIRRPRSSISGSYAQTHGHHASRSSISSSAAFGLPDEPLRTGTPGPYGARTHAARAGSISAAGRRTPVPQSRHTAQDGEDDDAFDTSASHFAFSSSTSARRGSALLDKGGAPSGIPTPSGIPRRQSGGLSGGGGAIPIHPGLSARRQSGGAGSLAQGLGMLGPSSSAVGSSVEGERERRGGG